MKSDLRSFSRVAQKVNLERTALASGSLNRVSTNPTLDRNIFENGNLVTFMKYPGEFHYFAPEHVLRDACHRVDDFFALHLRGELSREY